MLPFYFGSRDKQLYGVYHPSKRYPSFSHGVLLCPPVGHEYMRTHLAFQQLAIKLSKIGFDVLKFDYYGVGDSAGESDQGNIEVWEKDISKAYQELKDISGVTSVSIVGLRLGASLVFSIVSSGLNVKSIVLWDPVINGDSYTQELKKLTEIVQKERTDGGSDDHEVLVGFPYSTLNLKKISNLNLLNLNIRKKLKLSLILSEYRSDYIAFKDHIQASENHVEVIDLSDTSNPNIIDSNGSFSTQSKIIISPWNNPADFDQALLTPYAITKIVSVLKNSI